MWGAQARVLGCTWRRPAAWVSRGVQRGRLKAVAVRGGLSQAGGGLSTHSAERARELRAQCAWRSGPRAGGGEAAPGRSRLHPSPRLPCWPAPHPPRTFLGRLTLSLPSPWSRAHPISQGGTDCDPGKPQEIPPAGEPWPFLLRVSLTSRLRGRAAGLRPPSHPTFSQPWARAQGHSCGWQELAPHPCGLLTQLAPCLTLAAPDSEGPRGRPHADSEGMSAPPLSGSGAVPARPSSRRAPAPPQSHITGLPSTLPRRPAASSRAEGRAGRDGHPLP